MNKAFKPTKTNTIVVDFSVRTLLGNIMIEGGQNDDGSYQVVIEWNGWAQYPFRSTGMKSEEVTKRIMKCAQNTLNNKANRFWLEVSPKAFA